MLPALPKISKETGSRRFFTLSEALGELEEVEDALAGAECVWVRVLPGLAVASADFAFGRPAVFFRRPGEGWKRVEVGNPGGEPESIRGT